MTASLSAAEIVAHATDLHRALRDGQAIEPLSERIAGLRLEDAYAISRNLLQRRLDEGERVVGKKIGATSSAVQRMLKVDQPDFGFLTDRMAVRNGATLSLDGMIAPRAEGEIAFHLKHDLCGPGITHHDVVAATESLSVCFEIVDSRIRDWKIGITDTVADNASAAAFVLGDRRVPPKGLDLGTLGMVVEKNGELVASGAGAAALGSPINCVVWLANTLGRLGTPLKAGETILSGALVPLIPVQRGDHMCVRVGALGSAEVHFA
ncbi:2-oxopent-4-enoate hydratase [Stenotrophomonas sp. ISL-67]|uniref:fumarylacetoacetate hydrolase family protein n=1 Tax=Stenotrophomonas sp. ISL-67 TaxID=2819171 RepID=UPI001BEB1EEF|nr:fumarylacetoacetate hydrolase family protein [Stenotrophomonas sp. ISL-67]MBT2766843.1 2-oxopent-4-enoate hydratase [Stenotrophomonas sp. ISL-67]